MATAVALNATSSILNNQGLGTSPSLLANIATYQSKSALSAFSNCYVNAGITSAVTANILTQINSVGTGITSGHFLLDLFPSNITPVSSAPITAFTANLVLPVGSLISHLGKIYTTTGNVFAESFDGSVINSVLLTGVSGLVKKQALLPFSAGYSGFANIYQRCDGYANQVFDTVSSIKILKNSTYSDTGVEFAGPTDLVTNGIGSSAKIVANVVANWGTMYDINNLTKIGDPYVFGQHLLNQGLGYINALADQLTAVGLDVTNLPEVPAVISTVTLEESVTIVSSFVGEIEFPVLNEVTRTESVAGNSPAVVNKIYQTVTAGNLSAITTATAITVSNNSQNLIVNLSDYLDLKKITTIPDYTALNQLNIYSLNDLANYLGKKLGGATFQSWTALSKFLLSLETPALNFLPSGADTKILYDSTVTTLTNQFGTGSGELGNPVLIDYLGACAGDPYTNQFNIVNTSYNSLATASGITTALSNLDRAIIDYSNAYAVYLGSAIPDSAVPPDPPAGDAVPPDPSLLPSFTMITSNVSAVNTAMNSLPITGALAEAVVASNSAWYMMLNRLPIEVENLIRADVSFTPGTPLQLLGFAENIGVTASDKAGLQSYQFFANILTNNAGGDSIRAVVAENINTQALTTVGVSIYNNPDPRFTVFQSQAQNVSLTTYLSQNK